MAMKPYACGNARASPRQCRCAAGEIERYRVRLSGALTDRIHLHLQVGAVPVGMLAVRGRGAVSDRPPSAIVWRRRAVQRTRYSAMPGVFCNAHAPARALDSPEGIEPPARDLLSAAAERNGLTARSCHRVLRVARTIGDVDAAAAIAASHIAEALC
jgi:magnesium chelatase family protein